MRKLKHTRLHEVGATITKVNALIMLIVGVFIFFALTLLAWVPSDRTNLTRIRLNDRLLQLEVADNVEERQLGLSGRDKLNDKRGMLFVFDESGQHCFWMRGMRFPIDIVWMDTDKRIVYQKTDVSPATYPESFCPDTPAKYVLEFNAGTSRELMLTVGQQLPF